jgi:transposase
MDPGQRRRIEPDWAELARELKRPGVNLTVLWEEYREIHIEIDQAFECLLQSR